MAELLPGCLTLTLTLRLPVTLMIILTVHVHTLYSNPLSARACRGNALALTNNHNLNDNPNLNPCINPNPNPNLLTLSAGPCR